MVALRIKGRAPLADMMQSGIFGLIRAAEKFDPERGYKFSTYAYFWILQSMKRGEAEEYTIALPFMLINKVMCGQEVELSGESVAAAKNAYSVRSLDAMQFFDDGDGESLGDAIHGGSLDAGDLGWSAALGALQEVDPDDLALLTLHGVDGATYRDLAQLEDVDPKTMGNRVRETRARLAAMPEVAACLA